MVDANGMLAPSDAALPSRLLVMMPPASAAELKDAEVRRDPFLYPGEPRPYMNDIVRAFRVAHGARSYLEVGSRDKGNVAWLAPKLACDATIVETDIEKNATQEVRLQSAILPGQRLVSLTGDCLDPACIDDVRRALPNGQAEVIFCDTLHWRKHTLQEVAVYKSLLAPGGVMFIHDAFYPGDEVDQGKSHAFQELNMSFPVYCVFCDEPPTRYQPRKEPGIVWGGLAVILG